MIQLSPRKLCFSGFLFAIGLLGAAYYLQYFHGLEPCPLCILQRIVFLLLALICLIATLLPTKKLSLQCSAGAIIFVALIGTAIAARHIWLVHLPPETVFSCGPSLDYLLETIPLLDVLKIMLKGSADCAEITWTLFGVSLPTWSLFGYVIFIMLGVLLLYKLGDNPNR